MELPQPSAKHRRIMTAINAIGLVVVIGAVWYMRPQATGDSVVPLASTEPADARVDYCDAFPDPNEEEAELIERSSLYARYITSRYTVLVAVDVNPCLEDRERYCLHCVSVALSDEGTRETAERFDSVCNVFMRISHDAERLPLAEREVILDGYVHVGAASIVSEVSSERICNLRYSFEAEELFPAAPPSAPEPAPDPGGPISI